MQTTSARSLLAAVVLSFACRNAPEPPALPATPTPAHPSRVLPPGHATADPASPAPPPSAEAHELRWSDPVGWRRTQPSSSMRRAQYAVPGATPADDAEVAVFYFGVGQGGSVEDNIRRWQGQFASDPNAPAAAPPTTERTVHGLRVHLTERFGRFAGMAMPNAPSPTGHDNWGMLGAIVETPQGPWFFKLTGPRATVEGARARFDDLVASFEAP